MYDILDETNDYALDKKPEALELTDTDVVVLQDLNEDTSLDEGCLVIERALNDLDRLVNTSALVTEAIANKFVDKGRAFLKDSINIRSELEQRYFKNRSPRLATEAFHYGYDVLVALEAESSEQKNIFQKMIDAIVKAFKWLWNGIKNLFSKVVPDNKEKQEKERDKIKNAEDSGVKPDPDPATDDRLGDYFPEISGDVAVGVVEKAVADTAKAVKEIKDFHQTIGSLFESIRNVSELIRKKDYETLGAYGGKITMSLNAIIKSLPVISKADAESIGVTIPGTEAHALSGFLKKGSLIVYLEEVEGIPHPRAKFGTLKADQEKKEKKFKVASSNEISRIIEDADKIKKTTEEVKKIFLKLQDTGDKLTTVESIDALKMADEELRNNLNLSSEEKSSLKVGWKLLQSVLKDTGSFVKEFVTAIQSAEKTLTIADDYIKLCSKSYVAKEENKEEKSEDKKPEATEEKKD